MTAFLSWWAGALLDFGGGTLLGLGIRWILDKRFPHDKSPPGRPGGSGV